MLSPILNYLPLLPDAQLLQVLEADAHLRVEVRGKLPCGVHVVPQLVMVPEDLVLLVEGWDDAVVLARRPYLRIGHLPPRLPLRPLVLIELQQLVLKSDVAGEISGVTDASVCC